MGRPKPAELNGQNQVPSEGTTAGGGAGGTSAPQESIKPVLEMYLKEVKELFHDQEEKYNNFHQVVKDFMDQRTDDVVSVIAQVKELLKGHNNFIYKFNSFLPNGYEIIPDDDTPPQGIPNGFLDAINFVNKLKHVYRSFLDVLNSYSENKCSIIEVYIRVAYLLEGHPDLFAQFDSFMPNTRT